MQGFVLSEQNLALFLFCGDSFHKSFGLFQFKISIVIVIDKNEAVELESFFCL